jgi:phage gp29-like protein
VIVKEAGEDPEKGIDYRSGKLAQWVIEAGDPFDLGLLLKLSPSAISKKNMLAYWDTFGEVFGMPVRVATTTSRDDKELTKIENMLMNMGAAPYGLFPEGTTVEFKETSRGDAFNVYDKRIDRANSEISKCILNQTMTIDNGSSYSQSEVHLEVFQNIVESDADFLRDIINNKLFPFLTVHGFPFGGYVFGWDDTPNYTPEDMRTIEQMLLTAGYEIEPNYFIEKYNIPITGRREIQPVLSKELSREDGCFFL